MLGEAFLLGYRRLPFASSYVPTVDVTTHGGVYAFVFLLGVYTVAWLEHLALSTVRGTVAGIYALMSFTVTQRRREIGLRRALGALPSSIVSTIGRRAFAPLLLGVAVGAVGIGRVRVGLEGRRLARHRALDLFVRQDRWFAHLSTSR